MATAIEVSRKLEAALEEKAVRAQLEKMAADGMDPARLIANARAEVAGSETLAACSVSSILRAVMAAARAGLQLGTYGEGYLVAFKGTCTFIAGWRGLLKIAYDGGAVRAIEAHLVREGDDFAHWLDDTGAHFRHVPKAFGGDDRRVIGAYAYAVLNNGGVLFEPMSEAEILAIRDASPAGRSKSTPWHTHPGEMYRKTPMHRLLKRVPMSDKARIRMAEIEAHALTIEGFEEPKRRTLGDAIKVAAQGVTGLAVSPEPEPPQLPEGGPALSFLLSLVDVDLEQRAALLAIEDADLSRHLDTLADMPESQRSAYVTKSIIGGANV